MEKITYLPVTVDQVAVFLAGKRVGTIDALISGRGWRYTPKGSTRSGEIFSSLRLCKQSLEAQ
jgi:hypothetical protein